ncbi:MAG: restriction endonuclease-like protein [Candidatus Obscuribacterales bacterium]|nr:restriction endonuclease-like protein [Candidatus Obscuribacterales bacterium]
MPTSGPPLYEQTDYKVYLRSHNGQILSLLHRDPSICSGLVEEENGSLLFGSINFRNDVGLSSFTVTVDGIPEFEFEIEIFPSKLDYKEDYERLIAETQEYVSGLVFEYLRSTYRLSFPNLPKQSSRVEWLLLLKMMIGELEQALHYIAQHPVRRIIRNTEPVRAERIKRFDTSVRTAIQRQAGYGAPARLSESLMVRRHLPARKASSTLDTPEHKWLANQLQRIRECLLSIKSNELCRDKTERRSKIIEELEVFEQRILSLQKLEPFTECEGIPPAGFASLQLLTAPGYKEAYRACTLLSLGLQIEGGPVNLSLKELSLLYEYWCFLSVIHMIAELLEEPIPVEQIVKAKRSGLEISLEKGKESRVHFKTNQGRQITVSYNRHIVGASVLTPQKPDIMITFEDADWPALSLLLDAKYRIKFDRDYVEQFGAPGPPIDAVNALHRYRDAILEANVKVLDDRPKRTVIQAAALFPFREHESGEYRQSKLWKSIDKLGIGAIPFLPESKDYFREWLLSILRHGGWEISDRAIGYHSQDKARDWQNAAAEAALIAVLRSENSSEHLDWIISNQTYYMPLHKSQSRQLNTKWIAIYSPSAIRNPGAVTHRARVLDIEVLPRHQISTPWAAAHTKDDLQVVFRLDKMETLKRPILNLDQNDRGQRFSTHRWSSRLSVERAKIISELFLESESEWRLYEELKAAQIQFHLEPVQPGPLDIRPEGWRTWFVIDKTGHRIRFAGVHGILIRPQFGREKLIAKIADVINFLLGTGQSEIT